MVTADVAGVFYPHPGEGKGALTVFCVAGVEQVAERYALAQDSLTKAMQRAVALGNAGEEVVQKTSMLAS